MHCQIIAYDTQLHNAAQSQIIIIQQHICCIHCNWVYIQNIWAIEFTNDLEVPTYPKYYPNLSKKRERKGSRHCGHCRWLLLAAAGCRLHQSKWRPAAAGGSIEYFSYSLIQKNILYARQLLQLSKVFALVFALKLVVPWGSPLCSCCATETASQQLSRRWSPSQQAAAKTLLELGVANHQAVQEMENCRKSMARAKPFQNPKQNRRV